MKPIKESASKRVMEAQKNAREMMRKAGFDVGNGIQVSVDPKLPFMGYSFPQGKNFRIVASGGALKSGMLEGLLIHEMSHIFRMQGNHPSHNGHLIQDVINSLGKRALSHDYQRRIIRDIVNNIEDLYADDIAFQVMKKVQLYTPDQMGSFLQDWVKDEPIKSQDGRRETWFNASIMANNARAIGQMRRLGIEDTDRRAANANKRFLSRVNPSIASQFDYFLNLLTNLREDITEEDHRRLLIDYLNRFLEVAENNQEALGAEQWPLK